jgi:hypothetical protein
MSKIDVDTGGEYAALVNLWEGYYSSKGCLINSKINPETNLNASNDDPDLGIGVCKLSDNVYLDGLRTGAHYRNHSVRVTSAVAPNRRRLQSDAAGTPLEPPYFKSSPAATSPTTTSCDALSAGAAAGIAIGGTLLAVGLAWVTYTMLKGRGNKESYPNVRPSAVSTGLFPPLVLTASSRDTL